MNGICECRKGARRERGERIVNDLDKVQKWTVTNGRYTNFMRSPSTKFSTKKTNDPMAYVGLNARIVPHPRSSEILLTTRIGAVRTYSKCYSQ